MEPAALGQKRTLSSQPLATTLRFVDHCEAMLLQLKARSSNHTPVAVLCLLFNAPILRLHYLKKIWTSPYGTARKNCANQKCEIQLSRNSGMTSHESNCLLSARTSQSKRKNKQTDKEDRQPKNGDRG